MSHPKEIYYIQTGVAFENFDDARDASIEAATKSLLSYISKYEDGKTVNEPPSFFLEEGENKKNAIRIAREFANSLDGKLVTTYKKK